MTDRAPVIKDPKDLPPLRRWITEITYAEAELQKFYERARRVVRRFLDERDAVDTGQKWFNLFYANTKILKAAMYAQLPTPEVKRKFTDYDDDLARVAASILQRCISPDRDDPRDTFDPVMRNTVIDRLIPGLGQAWLRLETDTEDVELILESAPSVGEALPDGGHGSPLNSGFATGPAPDEQQAQAAALAPPGGPQMASAPGAAAPGGAVSSQPPGGPGALPPAGGGGVPPSAGGAPPSPPVVAPPPPPPQVIKFKRITDQRVVIDYVYWEDFIWSPCRVWEERRWIGRRVYMDYDALVKRFGEEKAEDIPLNYRPLQANTSIYPTASTPTHQAVQQACVYEIWDRLERKVVWLCKDCDYLLDEKDDFLNLVGFEPCPKPLLANVTTSNTVPRPDYYLIQDQYVELDGLNNRIALLVRACKVVGVYDQSAEGIQRMLIEGIDNIMIPVDNWAMFAEKGGVQGSIDWLPLDKVVMALQKLYEAREGVKAQIYELTGISDIVRGASKASETLGAQEIKAKFASVRIKDTQDEIAEFASQILRLKAEILVKHFEPEIILRKSNILRTDDAGLAHEAVELLRSEEGFEWRISVTSDQMAQADYAMEKQDRIELLTSVSGFLPQAVGMIAQAPEMAPLLISILKWVVSGFKGARDIEGMLDRELDNMLKAKQQGQEQEKPDPEAEKAKAEIEGIEAKTQASKEQAQIKHQSSVMDLQVKSQKNKMELQASAMSHRQKMEQLRQESLFDMVNRMSKPNPKQVQ